MASPADPAPPPAMDDQTNCARRRIIIAAAGALLGEHGLEGLTIRAVLKRTGLARRAFYERFAGKDDLVVAVFGETLSNAADLFRQTTDLSQPLEGLRAVVSGLLRGAAHRSDADASKLASAMTHEHLRLAQTRPAELQAALAPLLSVIAELISAGISAGKLRPGDPSLQATLIYNLVATTVHTEVLLEESGEVADDRQQHLADEIWEFCRRAIVA